MSASKSSGLSDGTRRYWSPWTQKIIHTWGEKRRIAWQNRESNPDRYLYFFPAPGARKVNGEFSEAERHAFDARVLTFTQKGWPLSLWGLFSLVFPHRTGQECENYAKQCNLPLVKNNNSSSNNNPIPSKQDCIAYHKQQLEDLWTTPEALETIAKVDVWLNEPPPLPIAAGFRGATGITIREPPATELAGHLLQRERNFHTPVSEPSVAPLQRALEQRPSSARWTGHLASAGPTRYTSIIAAPGDNNNAIATSRSNEKENSANGGDGIVARRPSPVGFNFTWPGSGSRNVVASSEQQQGNIPSAAVHCPRSTEVPLQNQQQPQLERITAAATLEKPGESENADELDVPLAARKAKVHAGLNSKRPPPNTIAAAAAAPTNNIPPPQMKKPLALPKGAHTTTTDIRSLKRPSTTNDDTLEGAVGNVKNKKAKKLAPAAGGGNGEKKPKAAIVNRNNSSKTYKPAAAVLDKRKNLGDSDDDDFQPGTLKPLASSKPITNTLKDAKGDDNDSKAANDKNEKQQKKKAAPKRAKAGMFLASKAMNAAVMGAGDEFSALENNGDHESITVVRLQADKEPPGWSRRVQPYIPPLVQSNTRKGQVVVCDDILSFDISSLGGDFLGVIVNAPLIENQNSSSSSRRAGITSTQLASLQMDLAAASNAIICVWATGRFVGQAVRCLASWGARYVENLTWVELSASGGVLTRHAEESSYVGQSHRSLVMGRRGTGELELRHQRTPDVLVAHDKGGGRFPDEARAMLETLLPLGEEDRENKKARFLEIAFHGAEMQGREGWVTLVQR